MVIRKSREGIQSTVKKLIKIGKDIGSTINSRKTKYLMVKQGRVTIITLAWDIISLNKYKS